MANLLEDQAVLEPDPVAGVGAGLAPWHFWAVVAIALFWNGFPSIDYTMTQLRDPAWIGQLEPWRRELIENAPAWATAAWALGGWGGLAGAVLMLLRSRRAIAAFAVSLAGAIVSFAWQLSVGLVETPILPAVIVASIAFFWWYAARMRGEGVLR
jgi:hypothetical protein